MCGALLTLGLVSVLHPGSHDSFSHQSDTRYSHLQSTLAPDLSAPAFIKAGWQAQRAAETPHPTPSLTISVSVSKTQDADLNALHEALANATPLPGELPASGHSNEALSPVPAWFAWGQLNSQRVSVQVTAPLRLPANALGVYAARSEYGATLCLVNKTNARLLTSAVVQLPRGAYRIERLTFAQPSDITKDLNKDPNSEDKTASDKEANNNKANNKVANAQGSETNALPLQNIAAQNSAENASPAPAQLLPGIEHLERLEGCDFGSTHTARKGLCLEPGEVCFYRYTDVARMARATWYDVFAQLHEMAHAHPGPAHRLATMLHEADGYVSNVQGRGGEGVEGRLESIHHLLLVAAQAHSLHHNYQMRHTVDVAEGKAVMVALNRLIDSLSETSAVLLGLVPQVAVTSPIDSASKQGAAATGTRLSAQPDHVSQPLSQRPDGSQDIKNAGGKEKEEKTVSVANQRSETVRSVTIALANTGSHSISNVKLGLNTANLPASVAYYPADPAYFGTLHPGQTIRATFRLRGTALQEMSEMRVTGDVSYFAGTAPAHLCPQAW